MSSIPKRKLFCLRTRNYLELAFWITFCKQLKMHAGSIQELLKFIEAGCNRKLTKLAAAAIAVFTADSDASRKKKVGAAGIFSHSQMTFPFT